ncbi:response regulator [Desulfovibrio sp. JC022]|uniref:hybrid sensor histidine kinase/response regulator n=1 Tax=Desulfovibrio sp. JC022 TaxID=2593642 RepID=UPI0013D84649|nr:response regulator [Desulfovibrio sp. JC022]NDV24570.1 response regulator [Desulfovibrio sp. JC022]
MPMIDGDLKNRLLAAFRGESSERMRVLSSDFLQLEKGCGSEDLAAVIESSYRELHSLKGAARAVGLGVVEEFCQAFESFFSVLKQLQLVPSGKTCSMMLGWLDLLEDMLREEDDSVEAKASPAVMLAISRMQEVVDSPQLIDGVDDLSTQVDALSEAEDNVEGHDTESDFGEFEQNDAELIKHDSGTNPAAMGDSVRVSSSFLTGLLLQTEELISSRNAQRSRIQEISELDKLLADFTSFYHGSNEGHVASLSGEELKQNLVMGKKLDDFSRRFSALGVLARKAERDLTSKIDSLLGDFKNSMLLPFSSLLDVFPRMVRTLSMEQGKECRMESSGENVRIDRRILEMLHDPLMHMLRNSIDHGIESREDRIAQDKDPVGRIFFSITQSDRDVVKIVYGDDGRGIDLERLKAVAVNSGIISADDAENMDRRSALELVFISGMSSSKIITDISGRGLGMAIVRDKVESLGGSIVVASPEGKGFRIVLNIPVALTSFRGIVVESGEKSFVVPKSGVRKVMLVRQDDIASVGGKETVFVFGRPLPLISLAEILELESKENQDGAFPVLIAGKGRKAVAISVDGLSGEQDVMAKSMGPLLKRVRNVSGFSMLGSGELVPILHTPDMARTALGMHAEGRVRSVVHRQGIKELKTVLVAEDSITSRMLLKNVLEAAGYNVVTAVNGLDALQKIESSLPDVLVSDVEMPQMDGFTLTSKVRSIDSCANLPIILVTSLGSAEDRERGVEAGADAYIIKSSFDQGNLLEVIDRLAG